MTPPLGKYVTFHTQLRWNPDAAAYLARRLAAGNTKPEALRALKRRLSDLVCRALRTDATTTALGPDTARAEAA